MCGICGVVQVGGEPRELVAPGVLDRMTDAMVHRGPNDRGTYEARGSRSGRGGCRSSTSRGATSRPRTRTGTVWAVQNGELYNHLELRRRLAATDTRSEPLRHRDPAAPVRARRAEVPGAAAGQVRDRGLGRRRRRGGARPRPARGEAALLGAAAATSSCSRSELKSLLASGLVEPELDYEAIDAYLTFGFFPAPSTPLADVHKLLPGHRL